MPFHLAQINIGRILAPTDSPLMKEFMDNLDAVNAMAEATPGFVWRLQSESGNATDVPYCDDPFLIVNVTVWESIESLHAFTYKSHHLEFFKKRGQWFEKARTPTYALWWVSAGHLPTVEEAKERLEHYQRHGATEYSFWFSKPFPKPSIVTQNA